MTPTLYEQLGAVVNQLPELCTLCLVFAAILPKQALPSQTGDMRRGTLALQGLSSISRPGWGWSTFLPWHLLLLGHKICFVSQQRRLGLGWFFAFFNYSLMVRVCVQCNPTFPKTHVSSALTRQDQVFKTAEQPTVPMENLKVSWLQLLREFESFKARNIP